MKIALRYIMLMFVLLVAAQTSMYAQDGPDNEHPVYEDKTYHEAPVGDMDTEPENKITPVTKSSTVRDSSAVKITLPSQRTTNKASNQEATKENKPQPQHAQSGDDSILSFNFIYYIIQRFKLQDIIE